MKVSALRQISIVKVVSIAAGALAALMIVGFLARGWVRSDLFPSAAQIIVSARLSRAMRASTSDLYASLPVQSGSERLSNSRPQCSPGISKGITLAASCDTGAAPVVIEVTNSDSSTSGLETLFSNLVRYS